MDGDIWVTSKEGEGSAFHFTFVCSLSDRNESLEEVALSEAATRDLNILLAEDNPVNQRLTARLIEKRGHKVTVVEDGRQAVGTIKDQTFDLVLMDVQMPEMDGLEATSEIRRLGIKVPVFALTANAMEGDREKCLEAGMDGYLAKPLVTEDLYRILQEVEEKGPAN